MYMKTEDYLSPAVTITWIGMSGFLCVSLIDEDSWTDDIIDDTPDDYEEME